MPDFNHTATTNTSIYSERLWIPRSGHQQLPTRSLGMIRSSEPCFRKTFPAVCAGFIPIPSLVIIALVAAGTLNSSAANFNTAVNGVLSGTLRTLYGNRGSDVSVILKDTFDLRERTRGCYDRVGLRGEGRSGGTDTYMVEPPDTHRA